MRLIDADALIEVLQNREIHAENVDKRIAIKGDRQVVINAPTIPIRASAILLPPHAQWIEPISYDGLPADYYICSKCRCIYGQASKYCPSCGAKMNGKRREE